MIETTDKKGKKKPNPTPKNKKNSYKIMNPNENLNHAMTFKWGNPLKLKFLPQW